MRFIELLPRLTKESDAKTPVCPVKVCLKCEPAFTLSAASQLVALNPRVSRVPRRCILRACHSHSRAGLAACAAVVFNMYLHQ